MVWYSQLFKNFPQFVVIHTVRGFGIVYKAEVDVFLELSCFFDDSMARITSLKKKSMRYNYAGKLPKSIVTRGRRQCTPLQYSCLENPMDRGAWWASVHGVVKSQTRLCDFTFNFHFHALEKEMATHSSDLAWRIPGTVEPDGLLSMGLHRIGHD